MTRIERTMAVVRWALVVGSGLVAVYSVARYALPDETTQVSEANARYHCPMHPQIRSHDPGTCPICHMQLELIPESLRAPNEQRETPLPAGHAEVIVALERQQRFGIATIAVEEKTLTNERRYPAVLEVRPSAITEVRTRVPAFIETLLVDRVGARVRRGQPLARAFSPEVARLGDELALATSLSVDGGVDLSEATRAGLVRAGVNPTSASSGDADRRGRFTITATRSGFVTQIGVPVGAFASPEVALFTIADLDPLLAIASVHRTPELPLEPGAAATLELEGGATVAVTLDSIEPSLDPTTRTQRLRFSVPNERSTLLPGALGTLVLPGVPHAGIAIPSDSVLDDGSSKIVFVDRGEGRFEPREVTTAETADGLVTIRSGLEVGDRVVIRGGFLLDSESRLRAAMMPASNAPSTTNTNDASHADHAGHADHDGHGSHDAGATP